MKTLFLIDANSLIHRAFHALPPFTSPDGRPTGALYGISNILLKILREQKPDYIAAAFDRPEPTFRDKEYREYKATRPETAEGLIPQIIGARELFSLLGIKTLEMPGFEADDIIMTLANKFNQEDLRVVIFSGDLDILQAVRGENIVAQIPKTGISNTVIYNKEAVQDRFGVPPEKLADFKGLVGDKSDNIPGVRGVGPKTAAVLVMQYGSLENLFQEIEELGETKATKKLSGSKEIALLSKKLALLREDVPIKVDLEDFKRVNLNIPKIKEYFIQLGFKTVVDRLAAGYTDN
ncbi:MAG TPA: 5'-3' exonuclease H3TH domain-containing protein [Candidatus Paceibacterota bacterium]